MLGNRGSVPTQPMALPLESDGFASLPLTSPVTQGKFLGSLNLSFALSEKGQTDWSSPSSCGEDGVLCTL